MSIFVGCTIGPIFETINLARKPLEIWMSSYMYSRVAQIIIQELNKNEEVEILSPHEEIKSNKIEMFQGVNGAGIFSDHIIFRADNMSKEEVSEFFEEAKDKMYEEVSKEITCTIGAKQNLEKCKNYLMDKIYILEVVKDTTDKEVSKFPIKEIVEELELQDRFPPFLTKETADDFLLNFIEHNNLKEHSSWIKENNIKPQEFQNIANISGKPNLLLNNYLAIIYSDGDSMGKLSGIFAEKSETQNSYFKLSEFITERAKANIEYVRDYGAMPIYFGGDDMFFIAPIYGKNPNSQENKNQISVFQLVENLSKNFDKAWIDAKIPDKEKFKDIVPSLSFGITISHCKYPFRYMREDCQNALFGTAKNQTWAENRSKNAIAIELRKHSGQQSNLILCGHKFNGASAFSTVVKYINNIVQKEENNVDECAMSRSMHWKVMEQYPLIEGILKLPETEQKKHLKTWFVANSSQQDKKETNDFDLIIDAMCEIVRSIGYTEDNAKLIKNTIDGLFRLAEFMTTGKKDAYEVFI